jgi:hypothetical protein
MRDERICPILPLPTTTTLARRIPALARLRAADDENMAPDEAAIERTAVDTPVNNMINNWFATSMWMKANVALQMYRYSSRKRKVTTSSFCSFAVSC